MCNPWQEAYCFKHFAAQFITFILSRALAWLARKQRETPEIRAGGCSANVELRLWYSTPWQESQLARPEFTVSRSKQVPTRSCDSQSSSSTTSSIQLFHCPSSLDGARARSLAQKWMHGCTRQFVALRPRHCGFPHACAADEFAPSTGLETDSEVSKSLPLLPASAKCIHCLLALCSGS